MDKTESTEVKAEATNVKQTPQTVGESEQSQINNVPSALLYKTKSPKGKREMIRWADRESYGPKGDSGLNL